MQIFDLAEGTYRINYGQIAVLLNNLKKFVIKSTTVLPYYDFSYTGLIKVFECRRSESATELVFGKTVTSYLFFFSNYFYYMYDSIIICLQPFFYRLLILEKLTKSEGMKPSIFEPAENDYERSWQIFQNLHKDLPYGPKESRVCFF